MKLIEEYAVPITSDTDAMACLAGRVKEARFITYKIGQVEFREFAINSLCVWEIATFR